MKKILSLALVLLLIFSSALLTACKGNGSGCKDGAHIDANDNGTCDVCKSSVLVVIDFYAVNDLHGKFCDTDKQPGVDELATYFNNAEITDENVVILASGDMWQGTAESYLTRGRIITEWMNEVGFVSMTLGNHDFDWGEDAIKENLAVAESDIEAEFTRISEAYNVPLEQVKSMIKTEDLEKDLLVKAAADLVKEKAIPVAPKAETAEAKEEK